MEDTYRLIGFGFSLVGITIALIKYINSVRDANSQTAKDIYNHIDKKADGLGNRIEKTDSRINQIEITLGRQSQIDLELEKNMERMRTDFTESNRECNRKLDSIQNSLNNLSEKFAKIEK